MLTGQQRFDRAARLAVVLADFHNRTTRDVVAILLECDDRSVTDLIDAIEGVTGETVID